jgi:hypothetical protein
MRALTQPDLQEEHAMLAKTIDIRIERPDLENFLSLIAEGEVSRQ